MIYMKKPVIAIFCTNDNGVALIKPQFSERVREAGGVPIGVPMYLGKEELERLVEISDGFLFSGGVDLDPSYFGEEKYCDSVEIDAVRDSLEMQAIPLCYESKKPIFGICRGEQVVAVALGGSLYQDIPSQRPTDIPHRQNVPSDTATHSVNVEEGSMLAEITKKKRLDVNTFHHQAVKSSGDLLNVVAVSDDGFIEALEGKYRDFLLLVQWHPEHMTGKYPEAKAMFDAFIKACIDSMPKDEE